ncbi:MAG TPA: hypothetical protein VEG27_10835 [Usitatibacter sp.]|nr:hypothetical protein [Usitatibacter sp.]
MSAARRIVIVCDGPAARPEAGRLAEALKREGAVVVVREADDRDDDLLDAISGSDLVIGWK